METKTKLFAAAHAFHAHGTKFSCTCAAGSTITPDCHGSQSIFSWDLVVSQLSHVEEQSQRWPLLRFVVYCSLCTLQKQTIAPTSGPTWSFHHFRVFSCEWASFSNHCNKRKCKKKCIFTWSVVLTAPFILHFVKDPHFLSCCEQHQLSPFMADKLLHRGLIELSHLF